jgi:hypothetical protein
MLRAALDCDGFQVVTEERASLAAGSFVAGDQGDRDAVVPAQGAVDSELADDLAVEVEVAPRRGRDRVAEHPVRRARHRVHRHHQGDVAAGLEHLRIATPGVVGNELARRVQFLRDQRVEVPILSRPVAVDDDDFRCPRGLRPADGGVDFLGVEAPALFVHRRAAVHLVPDHDPADAFHVRHDQNTHRGDDIRRGGGMNEDA